VLADFSVWFPSGIVFVGNRLPPLRMVGHTPRTIASHFEIG
jgi:hypothetical protein